MCLLEGLHACAKDKDDYSKSERVHHRWLIAARQHDLGCHVALSAAYLAALAEAASRGPA